MQVARPPPGSTTTCPLPGTLASDHHHRYRTGLRGISPPLATACLAASRAIAGRPPSSSPPVCCAPAIVDAARSSSLARPRLVGFWHSVGFTHPPRAVSLPVGHCPVRVGGLSPTFPCGWNVCEGVRVIMSGPATPARLRLMSDLKAMMQEPPEVR